MIHLEQTRRRDSVLSRHLGLAASTLNRDQAVFDLLRKYVSQAGLHQGIIATYLCAFGIYPEREALERWLTTAIETDLAPLAKELVAGAKRSGDTRYSARVELVAPDRNAVYFDVTHTLSFPFVTGIQRVVRKMIEGGQDAKLNWVPFRWMSERLVSPLDSEECSALINRSKTKTGTKSSPHRSGPPFRFRVARFIYLCLRAFVENLLPPKASHSLTTKLWAVRLKVSEKLAVRSGRKATAVIRNLVLFEARVHLPELISEYDRIAFYFSVKPCLKQLSLTFYDLIPIEYPETNLFLVERFISYMTLLQITDKVSGISEAVIRDVRGFTQLERFRDRGIQLEAHRLPYEIAAETSRRVTDQATGTPMKGLMVGTLDPRKNHVRVLRALRRLNKEGHPVDFTFVGKVGWQADTLLVAMESARVEGCKINYLEYVSDAELNRLYLDADFTVFPSLVEGYGLPIIESVARGKPCITSNRGSMKEVAELFGGCILVNPESDEEIASAIERLFDSKNYGPLLDSMHLPTELNGWAGYAVSVDRFL